MIFPSWKDPRLHLSLTFVALHTIGQVEFHFRLSIPQILTALLTCGLIEFVYTFRQKRVAAVAGERAADRQRDRVHHAHPRHAARRLVEHERPLDLRGRRRRSSMASKYLITWRGRHVFNPSNLGLVLCFLILGSERAEPLQFWWGPISPALLIVLGTIVAGGLRRSSRASVSSGRPCSSG